MVGNKIFLMNPKHQCHLSKWGECVYSSQSWKERTLLHESMFIPIDRQNLILKNGGKWSLSFETKASIHLSELGK